MKKLLLGLMMLLAFSYTFAQLEGTWKVAAQAGALGVGPTQGDISWWANTDGDITERHCFFDDKFVFNGDGSFNNVMDNETWLEDWQIGTFECGTPVYPHDGSSAATWVYDAGAGTLTLTGLGAHIGIPKAVNGAELTDPSEAPASITYIVTEISGTAMTIDINVGAGWWRFLFAKESASGEDASLSDLQVDGSTIPGFSPSISEYNFGLEPGTVDVPQITLATPTDPDATSVDITQASAIPGDATVEVTAANGTTTMTYTVSFAISYALTLPVTFDNESINYDLIDFGGNASEIIVDPTNAANMVAKSIKTDAAELWAGTTVGGTTGFAEPIPFEPGSTFMNVRVWSPTAGTPMRLKVEDSNDPTISVETEAVSTVASGWETLLFDFSNEAPGTAEINFGYNYNKASIFFNFGTTGGEAGEQTYYWDDMEFGEITSVESRNVQTLSILQNPMKDVLALNITQDIESVFVYNLSGQSFNVEMISQNKYDVSALNKGVYTVLVIDINGNSLVGKVLKQ